MDFIESCRHFIEIDSSPSQGTADIAEYAVKLCEQQGLTVKTHRERRAGVEQMNLVAFYPRHQGENELLLQSHLDTIDPGSFGLWSVTGHNPFNATISEQRIYGLGTSNVKLDFLCKLRALASWKDRDLRVRPLLTATHGGEMGTAGVIRLLRKKMTKAKVALVGAPTNLKIWHAAKGTAAVEIVIPFSEKEREFRAKHDELENSSSQSKIFSGDKSAQEDVNVILKMLKFLSQLPDGIAVLDLDGGVDRKRVPSFASLEFDLMDVGENSMACKMKEIVSAIEQVEKDFVNFRDDSFSSPLATLNIGMVRTQEESVILSGVCTIPPVVKEQTYQRWMDDLRNSCQKVGAEFRIVEYFPPFKIEPESSLVKVATERLAEMGLSPTPETAPGSSEANTLSRLGVQCLMFGAGQRGEKSRIENESVPLQSLEEASAFYREFIGEYCV